MGIVKLVIKDGIELTIDEAIEVYYDLQPIVMAHFNGGNKKTAKLDIDTIVDYVNKISPENNGEVRTEVIVDYLLKNNLARGFNHSRLNTAVSNILLRTCGMEKVSKGVYRERS